MRFAQNLDCQRNILSTKIIVHTLFCRKCIAKYIEFKSPGQQYSKYKLPWIEMWTPFGPCLLQPIIISPALFVKWSDLLCETYVLKWGRTSCPYRVCSELIVNESGGTVKKSKCPNCSKDFCFQCGVEWHAGYWCDEIEIERTRDE